MGKRSKSTRSGRSASAGKVFSSKRATSYKNETEPAKPVAKSRGKHALLNAFEIAEAEERKKARKNGEEYSDDSEDHDIDDVHDDGIVRFNKDGTRKVYQPGDEDEEDDDSEIDSDEAFGSDDGDEEILDSFGVKAKAKAKFKAMDDEYDSVDEEEFVDLSEAWDLDDRQQENLRKKSGEKSAVKEDSKKQAVAKTSFNLQDDDESHGDDESEEGDEEGDSEDVSDGQEIDSDNDEEDEEDDSDDSDSDGSVFSDVDTEFDEEKADKLRSLISNMYENDEDAEYEKRRRFENNNQEENEFGVTVSKKHNDGKLSLSDLTSGVDKKAAASLSLLGKPDGKSKNKPQHVAVPLSKRLQDKVERKAALELTREELTKFDDLLAQDEDAEHLVFPRLPVYDSDEEAKQTPNTGISALAPESAMEKKIAGILKTSALADESQAQKFEELATKNLSMEELAARRNELRRMRELMFREEQKARRIKKIKSKTYRKIHKRERERLRDAMSDEESDQEDHDMKRAQERMSLKHKNQGKWAKRMVSQGLTKDAETRGEMEEMLRRGESLRKKMTARDEDEDEEQVDSNLGDDQFLSQNRDALIDPDEPAEGANLGKGLLGMKFMREAEARQKTENQQRIAELDRAKANWELGQSDDEDSGRVDTANEILNQGRRRYAPGTKRSIADVLAVKIDSERKADLQSDDEEEEREDRDDNVTTVFKSEKETQKNDNDSESESDNANPWFTETNIHKSNKVKPVMEAESSARDRLAHKVAKHQNRVIESAKSKKARKQDNILIDTHDTLDLVTQEREADTDKGISFKQDMIKRAFAGDDIVEEEFLAEKRQRIADEGDQEIDMTLPGWGGWGGEGMKAPKKRFVKKIQGVAVEKRQDRDLKNVIISEKSDKKSDKYQVKSVPYPFESVEQYEAYLKMPMGQQWTTETTHQKLIKPRVIVKPGAIINPLDAPQK
ncbi:U3 small nucleolar RNA-associated protein 14 [Yarrowia sp. C11]|nr:U3 small nucleolar RNA-associated protein 14 [Yarrowia sp. E02]KAG5369555.1 U3 small nucleolar RNA-associated protein 14 [Yarrowia sp. C11]